MSERQTQPARPAIRRSGPLRLLGAGREALRTVPRLRRLVLLGFVLNYVVFILVAAVVLGLLYQYAVGPLGDQIDAISVGQGFFAGLLESTLRFLLWVTQALLLVATLLFAFLLSLTMMGFWYETLVGRIVAHVRGSAEEAPFSVVQWAGTLWRSLVDGLRLLALSALSLVLGFVPVLGPFLVVAVNSYLMGNEVREPYVAVREAMGERRDALLRGRTLWTLRVGLLPVVLALVPWVGWLLLPATMIYLVAGVAWESEHAQGG